MSARIFRGNVFVIASWTMTTVSSIWTVAFLFANLFQCWPIWINWTRFGSTEDNCMDTNMMYLAQAWSDVLIDRKYRSHTLLLRPSNMQKVIILSLPPPCVSIRLPGSRRYNHCSRMAQIWKLQMSKRQKLGISAMFLLGAL